MRLFIGIALPEEVRYRISADADRLKHVIPGKYVPAENYHLTLVFIGETDQNGAEKAKKAMAKAVQAQSSVNLCPRRLGYFGKKDHAILHRTVEGWEQLQDLDNRLRRNLKEEGLPFDRKPFLAHITLARKARINQKIMRASSDLKCSFQVNEITLFHSTRIDGILTYLPIGRASFQQRH